MLEEQGIKVSSAELVYKPLNVVPVDEGTKEKITGIIEKLEELGDVQNVFANFA